MHVLEHHQGYRQEEMLKYLPYRPGLVLLDCASGNGSLVDQVATWNGTAWGIDSGLGKVTRTARPRRIAIAAVEQLPFPDGAFDGVLCNGILRQASDPDRLAGEVARLLRQDGRLVLWEARRSYDGALGRRLCDTLQRAGLLPIWEEPFDCLAYPLAVLLGATRTLAFSRVAERSLQAAFAVDGLLLRVPAVRARSWHLIAVWGKAYV